MSFVGKHFRRFTPVLGAWIVLLLRYAGFLSYQIYTRNGGGNGTLVIPTLSAWQRLIAEAGLWAMFSLFLGLAVRVWVDRKSVGTGTDLSALFERRDTDSPEPGDRWEFCRYYVECCTIGVVLVCLLPLCFADLFAPRLGLVVLGILTFLPLVMVTVYLLLMFVFRLLRGDAREKASN